MDITWKEFKEQVEAEINAKGMDELIKINYIDISGGLTQDGISVYINNANELEILS